MERKYFQIRMNPMAHSQLKMRAKMLGISIGELVENLISSLELRLQRAYDTSDIQKGLIDNHLLKILLKDSLSINKKELQQELDKISTSTTNSTTTAANFKPTITI